MKRTITEEFDGDGKLLKRITVEEDEPQTSKMIPFIPYVPEPYQPQTPMVPNKFWYEITCKQE